MKRGPVSGSARSASPAEAARSAISSRVRSASGTSSSTAAEKIRIISDGFLLEHRLVDRLERAVADHEAGVALRRRAQHDRHGGAPVIVAQGRALQQALGLAPHQLGVGVKLVHQRLDGGRDRRADVALAGLGVGAQDRRHRLLHGEAQLVLAPPGGVVHGDAHAQQPLARGLKRDREPLVHHPLGLQVARLAAAEARHRRPAPDAQIAHPARTVLQVGLEQEDGVAEAAVPRPLLGAQPGHEVLGGGRGDARAKLGQKAVRQRLIADEEARVEQRRRRGQVRLRQRQRLIERPHGVAGVDLGVPQRVEDRLGEDAHVATGAIGAQHQ